MFVTINQIVQMVQMKARIVNLKNVNISSAYVQTVASKLQMVPYAYVPKVKLLKMIS